jgi:3-methyl-2-oxobutanoate hydroxymethyltransferase
LELGPGSSTDGQVMVIHDLLGISCLDKLPKFVKDYMKDSNSIQDALKNYVKEVKENKFPAKEHTFF